MKQQPGQAAAQGSHQNQQLGGAHRAGGGAVEGLDLDGRGETQAGIELLPVGFAQALPPGCEGFQARFQAPDLAGKESIRPVPSGAVSFRQRGFRGLGRQQVLPAG